MEMREEKGISLEVPFIANAVGLVEISERIFLPIEALRDAFVERFGESSVSELVDGSFTYHAQSESIDYFMTCMLHKQAEMPGGSLVADKAILQSFCLLISMNGERK